ncbi:MAG: glucosidase [Thermodesulfobacteriota bacterium]
MDNAEKKRLDDSREKITPWKKWGPYLSERQWGTVREDYSDTGTAWDYFPHDHARSRAYRWGEDGLAGISDDKQTLCFAIALWNGNDPIIKERLFGLTNSEGNHGEDVKEYYFYIDSTPTHSYMKYLYKYPHAAYPYRDLVRKNREATRNQLEYELINTGVFDDDRYFDVFVEYAKDSPEEILISITAVNRGKETAELHVLPTLWFRNTWSWSEPTPKPSIRQIKTGKEFTAAEASHEILGQRFLYYEGKADLLFTENETNTERIFGTPNPSPYVKDGINDYIVSGRKEAVNPRKTGTKVSAHYSLTIAAGEEKTVRLVLSDKSPEPAGRNPFRDFDKTTAVRKMEADEFYDSITPPSIDKDSKNVMRQALAGMLWTKQYYYFDLDKWLREHGADIMTMRSGKSVRNREWFHMINDDVISMPDKWEYPWYAAWDLGFHTIALDMVDPDFSRYQLELMLREVYLHPNGQIPAYEWNFSDVNPPVHAFACLFLYNTQKQLYGKGSVEFLKHVFDKLVLNFTWWVNRKDRHGKNIFEGGFLGLDNIGVFDRSSPLPTGGFLEQADGTAWMAMFCQNMLEIAFELAKFDQTYEEMALKFAEHFLWIASAMDRTGESHDEMWDEEDGFFYDILRFPDGSAERLKVRSLVGLLPLCASTVYDYETVERFPKFKERLKKRLDRMPDLLANIHPIAKTGYANRYLLSILNEDKLRRVLSSMLDENEFLSDYGIRSISRYHREHPYIFKVHGEEYKVEYMPAESSSGLFGGNSNWRGPIWFPINILIIRALLHLYKYYGDEFKVECPTGSGKFMTLYEAADEISRRLKSIFTRDEKGRRPVYGAAGKFQSDPNFRDYILFYEYFHGDNGAGIGASHQTGWTGLVAKLIQMYGYVTSELILEVPRGGAEVYKKKK